MDFIEGLPTSEGYNSILVVVARYTKYAHLFHLSILLQHTQWLEQC
jgi:hypothetical protein